jgi:nitroreductase
MTVTEAIQKRYSPKGFISKNIDNDILLEMINAAQATPSSYNEQPWRFVVVRKNDKNFAELINCLNETNQTWASTADVLIVNCAKTNLTRNNNVNSHAHYDTGMAAFAMILKATESGLFCRQMGGFNKQKTEELLNIPQGFEAISVAAFGYSETEQIKTPRKAMEEIVFNNAWEN